MESKFIYHILIDRFFPNVYFKEGSGVSFRGGNIQTVLQKLSYIQKLGANGIMLTPFYVCAENAYHGYHIIDYDNVDPHFGGWDDVRELIEEVHRRGMVIVADFVANHCHKDNLLYSSGNYRDWFLYDSNGNVKGFAGLDFLPMFNTDKESVMDYMLERILFLCKIGFDAIRLDHATGPSYEFWSFLRTEIKDKYPSVKLIGEVWGNLDFKPRDRCRYFINSIRFNKQEARQLEYVGILDGLLDFSYQSIIRKFVNKGNEIIGNKKLIEKINKHFNRYPSDFDLWIFLDNHDLNRFLFECNGSKDLLRQAIEFSKNMNKTYLMYYGTECNMANEISIFDGTPYADERVRQCLL